MRVTKATSGRFAVVDMARGVAIVAMVVYHFAWDLSFFGFVETDVARDSGWRTFARAIAGTFLFLVGIGLVLAHGRGIAWAAFARRWAKIAAGAAAVTLATLFAVPEGFIFFGILHAIALFSLMGLAFVRAPLALVALATAATLALPHLYRSPVFDTRWLAWIGLFETTPPTNDFEPVFPWFAAVLMGILTARLVMRREELAARLAAIPARGGAGRGLVTLGRWSLAIYLVHQPVLLAALYPLAMLQPARPAQDEAGFARACQSSCVQAGASAQICRQGCACAAEALKRNGLWEIVLHDRVDERERALVQSVTRQCFRPPATESEGAP